jgi:quercetin dioxygenase-like cupin family protein
MKLFRFDSSVGRLLDQFDSRRTIITRIAHLTQETFVRCFYLDAGGVVGYHSAGENQLFLVVAGQGKVRGRAGEWVSIAQGRAALWLAGEDHESRTETGMIALVLEGKDLDPTGFMVEQM